MTNAFRVDTQLFRELGELLVGRDSTALAELVKNSYDADATEVHVYGENLADKQNGLIRVKDDGIGMTPQEFELGFLTIASRSKGNLGNRQSLLKKRNVTGSKGIGRLAAHKLAAILEVESLPHPSKPGNLGIRATINWLEIEKVASFADISSTNAIKISTFQLPEKYVPGTTITLRNLRQSWKDSDIRTFASQINSYKAPSQLLQDPTEVFVSTSILGAINQNSYIENDNLEINLLGDFEIGDEPTSSYLKHADWLLEIKTDGETTIFNVVDLANKPTNASTSVRQEFVVPSEEMCPAFACRVYLQKGLRAWHNAGVGTYMEGFRVYPYGEQGNDWLDLNKRYNERTKNLTLPSVLGGVQSTKHFMRSPAKQFFGGVFLNTNSSPMLQMLVNREGFVANSAFAALIETVKTGFELLTRAVDAAHQQSEQREKNSPSTIRTERNEEAMPLQVRAEQTIEAAAAAAGRSSQELLAGNVDRATEAVRLATTELSTAMQLSRELTDEHRIIAVLAGIGTHLSAFTHDIKQLLAELTVIETELTSIVQSALPGSETPSRVSRLLVRLRETRRLVEHQSLHLADLVSNDARRRRSRLPLHEHFEKALRFLTSSIVRNLVSVNNEISEDLQTPPMFRSELSVLLANLGSNAIKAAGTGGRIWAHGRQTEDAVVLVIENTGEQVDLRNATVLFEPFVSTSSDIDPDLGRGTGLGLTIVKRIALSNSATVSFVEPSSGFATAISVEWSKR